MDPSLVLSSQPALCTPSGTARAKGKLIVRVTGTWMSEHGTGIADQVEGGPEVGMDAVGEA